jgi:hypothetical protein
MPLTKTFFAALGLVTDRLGGDLEDPRRVPVAAGLCSVRRSENAATAERTLRFTALPR